MMKRTTTAEIQRKLIIHFATCNCEECALMVGHGTWHTAYSKGYRAPRYPVPAIRKSPFNRFNSFDFYFRMGVINAICNQIIEEWRNGDATSVDRRE